MSGSATELKAVFTAEDRVQPALRSIAAGLRGLVNSGFGRFAAAAGQLGGSLASVAQSATLTAATVAGLGGAATAAGLVSLTTGAATAGAQLLAFAETAKTPIATMEVLAFTAQRAGVAGDALAGGLGELNTRLRDAAAGGGVELRQVLSRLGISLRDAQGNARGAADILPQLAVAMARIRDPALQSRLAMAAFGQSGEALLPLLRGGTAGLAAGAKAFGSYGSSIAPAARMLADAQRAFDDLKESATAFTGAVSLAIGTQLAPILAPIAAQMAEWLRVNREVVASGVAEYIGGLATQARNFFAQRGPIERLQSFAQSARGVVSALGGLKGVMIVFTTIVAAPFVASIVSIAANLALLTGVIARLGLVLLTTPFGWALAAVAALAAGAYLLWSRWDTVADFFRRFWARTVEAWGPQVSEIARLVGGLGRALVEPLMAAWEPVRAFFADLLRAISNAFSAAWERIQPIAERLIEAARAMNLAQNETSNPRMTPEAQAERTGYFGGRAGRMGGYYPPDRPVWNGLSDTGTSGLYVGPSARGSIEATIRFENAPPGTRVEATGSGIVQQPRTDLGLNLRTRLP